MEAGLFVEEANRLGLSLSESQIASFLEFEEALYRANEVMNLTRVPVEDCWVRHFLDSLLMHDLLPQSTRVLDIGCGPGFPSWPLACARPDLDVTGLDSNGKMIGFLQQHRLPNLEAVLHRAEEWRPGKPFDVVTGRAVAPLAAQLEVSARPCGLGGKVIPMRGASDRETLAAIDIEPLGLRLVDVIERVLPRADAVRLFPIYEKVAKTKPGYPRRWAEIKARPL